MNSQIYSQLNHTRITPFGQDPNLSKDLKSLLNTAGSKETELEIGRKTKFIHQKMKMIQYSTLLTNLIGICCSIVWVNNALS